MIDQDEVDDGDGIGNPSGEKKVFLEDMTDQELIEELITRERLIVITTSCRRPIINHRGNPDYMEEVQLQQVEDMCEYIFKSKLIEHSMIHNKNYNSMDYTSIAVMLTTLPEERPI